MNDDRPRVGISACLLGEPVRFDAGHKRDGFLVETFGRHVEWVPVCPEVEAGFGTPRDPMRLVARTDSAARPIPNRRRVPLQPNSRSVHVQPDSRRVRLQPDLEAVALIVIKSGADVTGRLVDYSRDRVQKLADERLDGYILKKDSPSCGMERVKVYRAGAMPERSGRGVFAQALITRFPTLPVEEEGRLSDPALRENFVERVFAYRRLRALWATRWTVGDLIAFHTAHKLTLMAHSPSAYRTLGRLVADARAKARRDLANEYETGFMAALSVVATPRRHANVLQHMLGYFKTSIDSDARAELLGLIDDHRLGRVPLIVPITLMRHHVRRQRVAYLAGQTYLDPHPRELSLRNHV
jgi:uncharacterized protein YbgA (DUF1722 family)/uncharacterized protein YbbK (DUF523 family)